MSVRASRVVRTGGVQTDRPDRPYRPDRQTDIIFPWIFCLFCCVLLFLLCYGLLWFSSGQEIAQRSKHTINYKNKEQLRTTMKKLRERIRTNRNTVGQTWKNYENNLGSNLGATRKNLEQLGKTRKKMNPIPGLQKAVPGPPGPTPYSLFRPPCDY